MTLQARRFILVALVVSGVAAASGAGPHAVGFVQVRESRTSLVGTARPVDFAIFYPVDAAEVSATTPRASYLQAPFGVARLVSSMRYDQFGYPPVFSEVPASVGGPFPLVLYSHGGGGQWIAGLWFAPLVASHGYVVVLLSHLEAAASWPERSVNRDGDLRYALDRLLARNTTEGDLLAGTLDPDRIVLSGYSMGGYNAIVLAGGEDDACDLWLYAPPPYCVALPADPRVKALLLLDASNQMLWFRELSRVAVPVLSIGEGYASLLADSGEPGWAAWQARQHAAFSGTPAYRVDLDPVRHFTLATPCENVIALRDSGYLTGSQAEAQLATIGCLRTDLLPTGAAHAIASRYVMAFLETHVAGRPGLQRVLTPGHALTHESHARFFVTEPNGGTAEAPGWADISFSFFPYQPGAATERAHPDGVVGAPVPFEAGD